MASLTKLAASTSREYEAVMRQVYGENRPSSPLEPLPISVQHLTSSRVRFFRFALRRHLLALGFKEAEVKQAVDRIELPKYRRVSLDIPTEEELSLFETALIDELRHTGRYALAMLPLRMGLRAHEALTLTREAVERAHSFGALAVVRKGNVQQMLPAKHARQLFEQMLDSYVADGAHRLNAPAPKKSRWAAAWQIMSPKSEKTAYHLLYRAVTGASKKSHIGHVRPHKLRHAFATRMLAEGAPLPNIQWMLGHAQIATTMIYVHPKAEDVERYLK